MKIEAALARGAVAKATTALILSAVFLSCAGAQERTPPTLTGLAGVQVKIMPSLDRDAERAGVAASVLRTDIELRLRRARIRVLGDDESPQASSATATLILVLGTDRIGPSSSSNFVYSVMLNLSEPVRLVRSSGGDSFAITWRSQLFLGTNGKRSLSQCVRDDLADLMDEFINAYLAANS